VPAFLAHVKKRDGRADCFSFFRGIRYNHREEGGDLAMVVFFGKGRRWLSPTLLLLVLCLVAGCSQAPQIILESSTPTPRTSTIPVPAAVTVHMAGAVERPGLYRLAAGSRVDDALKAAGGPTEEGDPDALNLAALLRDGEKITLPVKGAAPIANPGAVVQYPANLPGGTSTDGKVNINQATQAELESLPKIGEVLAQRIIDYRAKIGAFQTLEQLQEVSGIGEKTFEAIRELITLD
jgi:competence protein ComEA